MTDEKVSPVNGGKSTEDSPSIIQIILAIPNATIFQLTSKTATPNLIGHGELRVYSSVLPGVIPATNGVDGSNAPPTTFMTLETNETPTKSYKSLITHPLMPRSTAQKTSEKTWRFSVAGSGYLELQLPEASESEVATLENLLADRIIYTNQYKLRNQLALVDDVGQIYGVLDEEDVEMQDDDAVSLSENQKSPVVVEAIEPKEDEGQNKPLRLKISVPDADDMAHYLTSASQFFGENLVKGATVVAGGISTSGAYINSKIPETQKPLKISPFIKNRIRNVATISRTTFSVTSRVKSAIITRALNSGYRALKYWTSSDDPQSYSTMQNICYSILNSAGVLIQAAEESVGIVSAPAISATQELAAKLGPDAKEVITEALEGLKNFTLVYFDNAGVSRRAFLHTTRLAALQTAQEVKEGKLKMRERKEKKEAQEEKSSSGLSIPFGSQAKELYFSYFGKTNDQEDSSAAAAGASSSTKGKKKLE